LSHRVGPRWLVGVLVVGLVASLVGLGSSNGLQAAPTPFQVRGSVEQVSAVDLVAGDAVELVDAGGAVVASGTADTQGAILFRTVEVGSGYRVRSGGLESDPVTVMGRTDHPDPSFYDSISIEEGYGYVPTRDGTTLSINVTFPQDGSEGPWPVVVDYSGYSPSAPGAPPQEALVFSFQGYVVVGVNMRGTGCSGGAFDFFEYLQSLDGYDVVEAVARQPWSNGDVGLVGISYPGISQLFVAQTQPPHLDAITPVSVLADTYRSTLYPGGILNAGFALDWATDRVNGAKPAASQWAKDRINGGDATCADNQTLRLQSRDLLAEIRPDRFYEAAGDELAPRTFVDDIDVPVYMSGQFQDEQTGGHFSTMVPDFDPGTKLRVTLTNGTHVEPLGPEQMVQLTEFVDFYVGKRIPRVNPLIRAAIGAIYEPLFGFTGATLPDDRFSDYPTYAAALAAYEAEPSVRLLWENGAGGNPGEPYATAESRHDAWPVPGTVERTWYLQPDGELGESPPAFGDDEPRGVSSYVYDPSTKRASTFDGSTDAIWKPTPEIHWDPLTEGNSLNYVSEPFTTETAFAGWGSVDLWMRSAAPDTDVEVTITEVRPDGQERYIQSGWLRLSHRALDATRSTTLRPEHTHLEGDAAPMPSGAFVSARVGLFPFAHVVRPGSRLRLNIEAPGGNQPFWEYATVEPTGIQNDVAHSSGRPSRVVLPELPSAVAPDVPDLAPPCPSVRNQPCRDYLPARVPTDVQLVQSSDSTLDVTWSPPPGDGEPAEYIVAIVPAAADEIAAAGAPLGLGTRAVSAAATAATTATVAGDTRSLTFEARPGIAYVATVQAVYADGAAPVSNASLSALLEEEAVPPPTTQPAPDAEAVGEQAAAPTTGTLPRTGRDLWLPACVALALLLLGGGLVALSRRGRAQTGDVPPAR